MAAISKWTRPGALAVNLGLREMQRPVREGCKGEQKEAGGL